MFYATTTRMVFLGAASAAELPPQAMTAGAFIALAAGLAACFFGYRLLHILLGIAGFAAGWMVGSSVGAALAENVLWAIVGGLAGGVVGSVLFVILYVLGIFALGGFLGWLLGGFIASVWNHNLYPVLPAILAVCCGVTIMLFRRFILIAATSFIGAWGVLSGGLFLLSEDTNIPFDSQSLQTADGRLSYLLAIWLGIGLIGMAIQYIFTAPEEEPRRKRDDD